MKKTLIFILLVFLQFPGIGQIVLSDDILNTTQANKAFVLEDPDYKFDLKSIIKTDAFDFEKIDKPLDIIDFTTSRWFIRFEVRNPGAQKNIIFETARPITD